MRRKVLLLGGIAAAVVAALAVAFWPRHPRHLLVITLDTTRADRLGCYGYGPAQTPVLDELAASGALCSRAYTIAPLTLPAHVALFTGLAPEESGIVANGRGRVGDSVSTLARALRHEGYDTGAFIASFVLNHKFGLNQGFSVYDDDFAPDDPAHAAAHRRRNGRAVVDAALDWLAQKRSRPFFCWVHLYDPHFPYQTHPEEFGDAFSAAPYDGEIAYVDRQVGRLLDFLKAHDLERDTLVVVVGDHGEGLGQHGEKTHGELLYNSTLRVPLIFAQPGRLPGGVRVAQNVSLTDVYPTLLDLLQLDRDKKLRGRSLRPALEGRALGEAPCCAMTQEPLLKNGWAPLSCLIDGDWKFIQTPRAELYNLAEDPGELNNLAAEDAQRATAMSGQLHELRAQLVSRGKTAVRLTSSERQALQSLGYSGSRPAESAADDLPDIKDMIPFDSEVQEALRLKAGGDLDAAIARLQDVVHRAPEYLRAYLYLGDALAEQSRLDEAAAVFQSLLERRPVTPGGHYGLARVFAAQGRIYEAISEYRLEIEANAEPDDARFGLALALIQAGRRADALLQLDELLDADSGYVGGRLARAELLAREGRIPEAISDYREVVRYDPASAQGHFSLGTLLRDAGQLDDALRHLSRAAQLEPGNAEIHSLLGACLMESRQYRSAFEQLFEAVRLDPDDVVARNRLESARQALTEQHGQAD